MTVAARYRVFGRVQGVGFRYFVQSTAHGLHLVGWVRNCFDGTVEAFAQGEESSLKSFAMTLSEGPPGARVERVETQTVVPNQRLDRFSVLATE